MKNDIIINYSKITGMRDSIGKYKSALDTMEGSLKNIKSAIETENSGEAITALTREYEELQNYISSCREELNDLHNLFAGYYYDMTAIIKPKNEAINMQVDRTDIWYNLQSIISSAEEIGKLQRGASYVNAFATSTSSISSSDNLQTSYGSHKASSETKSIDEQEQKNEEENYKKLENIRNRISGSYSRIKSHYELLEQEFNNKIVTYEDMDDSYKNKAKSVYGKYSSFGEKAAISLVNYKEFEDNVSKGALNLLKDTYESVKNLATGGTMYILGAAAAEQQDKTGVKVSKENQKYIDAFNKGNEMFKNLLNDPEALVKGMIEGTAQQISDAYDQKGIGYCVGYSLSSIALGYGGDKLLGTVNDINKSDILNAGSETLSKINKTLSKLDESIGPGKIVINGEKISMAKILAKKGISKESVNVVIERLDTEDLEKLYKYLDKKPDNFDYDTFIGKIANGKSVDDTITWANIEEAHAWGEKEFSNWVDNLTPHENKAIQDYARGGSDVNKYLRGYSETINQDEIRRVYEINKALDKAEIPSDMTVYRGTGVSAIKEYLPYRGQITEDTIKNLVGQKIKDDAFMSTSVLKEASFHGKDVSWIINAPKGSNGAYIGTISRYGKQELEVLFNVGQEMVVKEAKITPEGKIEILVDLIK